MNVRIVHVIDGLGPGGAERLLAVYASEFHRTGQDVHVVTLSSRGGNPEQRNLEEAGVPTTLVPVGKLRNVFQAARLFSELRKLRPDVVHAHLQFASILSAVFCKLVSVPCLATIHTFESPGFASRDGIRMWLMCKVLERLCDRVICLSEASADFARKNGLARAHIEVLPNGVDLEQFSPRLESVRREIRGALGIPNEAPLILTVAVLRQPKGIDRLVRAMPAIGDAIRDAQLIVVGDGPEKDRLVALASELGVAHRVTFLGRRTDIPDLMAAADLFVLPTLDDVQPTVIMEAMASRLPLIASRVGGIPDMIQDGIDGVLVPADDVPALQEAISDLLADAPRRAALAAMARSTAEKRFSLKNQIARLSRLYEAVVEEGKRD